MLVKKTNDRQFYALSFYNKESIDKQFSHKPAKKQQFTLNPEYVHFTLQQHQFKIYFRTFFFVDIFY